MLKRISYLFAITALFLTYGVHFSVHNVYAAAPNAPTIFSPVDGAVVDDLNPILYAYYSDPDGGDTGTTEFRVSSGSAANCLAGVSIEDTGSSPESATTNEVVQYTVATSLTDTSTYNWCARNDDGTSQSAWTSMGAFTIYDATTLLASTYLGTASDDWGEGVGILPNGDVVAFTRVRDSAFPTTAGVIQPSDPSAATRRHAAVSVFNPTLTTLLRSTYIGGSDSDDYLRDGVVDENGNIYITGTSYSSDLPQSGILTGFDTTPDTDCGDTFVLKVNESLTSILFSTYIGGTDAVAVAAGEDCETMGGGIAVHPTSGVVMVSSHTTSESLPLTANAFDTTSDGPSNSWDGDIYVAFVDTTVSGASSNLYMSYIGDPFVYEWGYQEPYIDSAGIGYLAIEVYGAFSQTTPGAYETVYPNTGTDTVLLKIDPTGTSVSSLVYATFIEDSSPYAVSTDTDGNIFIIGSSGAAALATTPGTFDTTPSGSGDCFIYKIDPAGNGTADLLAGTYVPVCETLKVDNSGFVYFAGQTTDVAVPTSANAFRSSMVGGATRSGYVGKLSNNLVTLDYGSYYGIQGTNGIAYFNGSALDHKGSYYLGGEVFPQLTIDLTINSGDTTVGAYDATQNDNRDTFIARFVLPSDPIVPGPVATPPDAPVITGIAGHEEIQIDFPEPADNGSTMTQYEVRYGPKLGFPGNEVTVVVPYVAGAVSYTITGLTNETEYSVRVFATNVGGTSVASNVVDVTPSSIGNRRRDREEIGRAAAVYLGNKNAAEDEAQEMFNSLFHEAASFGDAFGLGQKLGLNVGQLSEVVYQSAAGGEEARVFTNDQFLIDLLPSQKHNILTLLDLLTQLRSLYSFMQVDDSQLLTSSRRVSEKSRLDFMRRNFLHLVGVKYFSFDTEFREDLTKVLDILVDWEKALLIKFGQVCYDESVIKYMTDLDYPDSPNWFHRYKEKSREWVTGVLGEQAAVSPGFVDWLKVDDKIQDPLKAYYQFVFGYCLAEAIES